MTCKKGITLLECLLYLTFMAWLFSASMVLISRTWTDCITLSRKQRSSITIYSAYDLIYRDIRGASANRESWKEITPTSMIWHKEGSDLGWFLKDNLLIRANGLYNPDTKKWKRKHANVIAQVDKVHFDCGSATRINQLHLTLSDPYNAIDTTIALTQWGFS